jgi:predicted TPR repeat methyltransferase
MKSLLEDTIWGASYGSVAAVQEAFDRIAPDYHETIMASVVPSGVAKAIMPHLTPDSRGIDFGCGSGALGLALRDAGLRVPLDGVDLSPVMLEFARRTGCYGELHRANLLLPQECPVLAQPYDFAVSVGLLGDYVPYYLGLPHIVSCVRPGGFIGYAVESRSTSQHALEKCARELNLTPISEMELPVPEGMLKEQVYQFYVAKVAVALRATED